MKKKERRNIDEATYKGVALNQIDIDNERIKKRVVQMY